MFRNLIILTIISLLSSCSINHHLKRSAKQLEKAIEKGYERQVDSVYRPDSTFVPQVKHDTTTIFMPGDTITVENERLRYRLIHSVKTDSIFIDVECKADTIIQDRLVEVNCDPIYIKQSPLDYYGITKWWQKGIFWLVMAALLVLFIYKQLPKNMLYKKK